MRWKEFGINLATLLCHAAILSIVIILCSSCSTKYVPVESVKTDVRYIDNIQDDSIYKLDSVYIRQKGDTIFLDKYKYLYKYMFINRVDSFCKIDTIKVPFPVEVEKKLNLWQRVKVTLGGYALAIMLFIIIWLVIKKRIK